MVQMVVYHQVIVFSFFSFLEKKFDYDWIFKYKKILLFFFFFPSFFSSAVGSGGKPCFSRSEATENKNKNRNINFLIFK